MEIKRDRQAHKLCLYQSSYLSKVLDRFDMGASKPVTIPMPHHYKLSTSQSPRTEEDKKYMAKIPYASAVGSLMFSMICTRPDLAYAISLVSRFMSDPGKEHWSAVKWVLRYLRGTVNHGLIYGKNVSNSVQVQGYVDSDYAGSIDTRKSITGYIFTVCGGVVSWKSTLQSVVALSTTEAEYIAMTEAVK